MANASLTLEDAARTLGVHYQTAYKWVRAGSLPAERVGGMYRIDEGDLERFERDRSRPVGPPKRRPRGGFDRLADTLHGHLVAGEESAARRIIADLTTDGLSLTEIAQQLIVPVMRRIGEEWYDGTLSIPTEHRATAIVERMLGEHLPNPRGRRRGRAVVAAVEGDRHVLPTTLALVALRDDNWHVDHLGADVPAEEVLRFVADGGVDLVVLTVSATDAGPTAALLADRLEAQGVRVLLGSPGATLTDLQDSARKNRTK